MNYLIKLVIYIFVWGDSFCFVGINRYLLYVIYIIECVNEELF